MDILWIFIWIFSIFFLILIIREFFNKKIKEKICSICLAISSTWIMLLLLFWFGKFHDKTIIAVLIGQTSLGLFYLWEKNVRKKFKVFRFPLLLTFIFVAYSVMESFNFSVFIFIAILWILFFVVYVFRRRKLKLFFNKILECCRKW